MQTAPQSQSATSARQLPPVCRDAKPSKVPESLRTNLREIMRSGRFPLYLFGIPGVGKTCAAGLMYASRGKKANGKCERVGWYSARTMLRQIVAARVDRSQFVDILIQAGTPTSVDYLHAWDQICRADFLVLDDIVTRGLTEAQSDLFVEVMDQRIGKATVLTGNLPESELQKLLDPRVVSRVFAGTAVEVTGVDQRHEGGERFIA